jgi:hypothetical protein
VLIVAYSTGRCNTANFVTCIFSLTRVVVCRTNRGAVQEAGMVGHVSAFAHGAVQPFSRPSVVGSASSGGADAAQDRLQALRSDLPGWFVVFVHVTCACSVTCTFA